MATRASSSKCLQYHHHHCNSSYSLSNRKPNAFQSVHFSYPSSSSSLRWSRQLHLSATRFQSEVIPFKLSDIGEGIKEVTIKEWFVREGDNVAQFDQICEVQSDKASVTITSRYDGVVRKLHYQVDAIALVGTALVDIEVAQSSRSAEETQEIQEGDAIQVGRQSAEESFSLPSVGTYAKAIAAPAVRRIAAEYKIDLKMVQGTGKDGRVLKEDVLNYISNRDKGITPQDPGKVASASVSGDAPGPAKPVPVPQQQQPGTTAVPLPKRTIEPQSDRTETIKGYTKTMIKTMTAANAIPHFGYSDEIDVSELLKLRKQLKDSIAHQYNIKLTTLSIFMKSASLALSQFPILNASLNLEANTIVFKGAHNIGIAMDTKLGLIVPNVKNVESKSILEIADDLQTLQRSALSGQVRPDDLKGGTFTISNIGSVGNDKGLAFAIITIIIDRSGVLKKFVLILCRLEVLMLIR